VTWATSMPILVFLGLSVLDLGPMYATGVRQKSDVRQKHRLMPPPIRGGGTTTCGKESKGLSILQSQLTIIELQLAAWKASMSPARSLRHGNNCDGVVDHKITRTNEVLAGGYQAAPTCQLESRTAITVTTAALFVRSGPPTLSDSMHCKSFIKALMAPPAGEIQLRLLSSIWTYITGCRKHGLCHLIWSSLTIRLVDLNTTSCRSNFTRSVELAAFISRSLSTRLLM